jgi:predicted AAA+ superfamily ATPase
MAALFESDLDTERLLWGWKYIRGKRYTRKYPVDFDEIQEVPKRFRVKYFYENAPQYHIVCAGSLLGIALHGGTAFRSERWSF